MLQGMSVAEARAKFQAHRPIYEERGVTFDGAQSYLPTAFKRDFNLALDAQPGLSTDPNASVPAMLTTYIDPDVYEIVFAPLAMAEILGEERKGDWLTETAMFPVVESAGEVSSYGDYNTNGRVTANTNWPNYQSYLFQIVMEYGDRELERAGLARINWVSELQKSGVRLLNTFANLNYAYGQAGLQNYGLLNDPDLAAPLTPATKAAGGVTWFTSSGAPNATANEVYNDILTVITALIIQTQGHIDSNSEMTLAMSPLSSSALDFTNSFGITVMDMLKKSYPNLKLKVAPQYGALSAQNPQGNAGGNFLQVIAKVVAGQRTGFCAYNEKLRSFPVKRELSSYRQKQISGVWGAIIRLPVGISSMLGI
jgi:hypothetical protein